MTDTGQLISNYNRIRQRLRYPPNAVPDQGINLRRNRIPSKPALVPIPKVLENILQTKGEHPPIVVSIIQIPAPPREPVAHRVSIRVIERAICKHFGVAVEALHGISRIKALVYPRHLFWYLCAEHTGLSLPRIAQRSNPHLARLRKPVRDHTTVLHAKRRIQEMLLVDEHTGNIVKLLEFVIFGGYHDADHQHNPTVAAVPQLNLAEKPEDQQGGLPGPEICAMDRSKSVDSQDSEAAKDHGGVQRDDSADTAEQAANRYRQPGKSPAGSGTKSESDPERQSVPPLDRILRAG